MESDGTGPYELPGEAELREYAYAHLGFYEIRDRLKACASSELGRKRIAQLSPAENRETVELLLEQTSQMRSLMARSSIPLGGMHDLEGILRRAAKRGVLSPEELLATADCVRAARRLKKMLMSRADEVPALAERVENLEPSAHLEEEVGRCINDQGEVADNASAELARIRRGLRTRADELRHRLESMATSSANRDYLQEPIVTQRNGRFVLPVKQEHRRRVRGIVHGQSSSGATVFVEPQVAVDLNNEIQNLKSEEEREIHRILSDLSDMVCENVERLRLEQQILADLDLIYARASWAEDIDAVRPDTNDGPYVLLRSARHPLLSGDVVPIDVEVGRSFDTLVITGPNTGGKTVTLKTVGLMVLMCQAGLHLPCDDGTDVGVFSRVYCDIGDEQSIAQNLSTFSSHMRNVIPIVKRADSRTLVLLDELGAGTDPSEGAPMAMAILKELHSRGVRTMATTHYSRLKTFAYRLDGVENASMEFDVETLSPTYHLNLGLPGRSNALEIASRLGMPGELISEARSLLSDEEGSVEELIAAMEADRKEWSRRRQEAEVDAGDARLLRERMVRREKKIRDEQVQVVQSLRREAREIVDAAREESRLLLREIHELVAELKRQLQSVGEEEDADADDLLRRAESLRALLNSLRGRTLSRLDELQGPQPKQASGDETDPSDVEPIDADRLRRGAAVHVIPLGRSGTVIDLDREREEAQVQVGVVKLRVSLDDLANDTSGQTEQRIARTGGDLARMKQETLSEEVTVRHMTVEEALARVKKHIDDAILAGVESVTVIHGRGEGILRRAIREYLEESPHVTGWRSADPREGGDGVTHVNLS
ncbi:MAG: endonuclease MutS2 [Bacillota bacterium]